MKINNCFLSLLILMFSWSVLIPQSYEEASNTVKEAEVLKDDGQYDESYDKTQEALAQIDATTTDIFNQIMMLKIGESKALADKALADAKQSGAATDVQFKSPYDKAMALYNSANASNTAPVVSSNNYTFALNSFDTVAKDATKIQNDYLTRERGLTSKAISDVRTKYNSSISSKSIVKGDNIDRVVTQALTSADRSLRADDFQVARKQAENALAQINLADKKHADLMKNSQNSVAKDDDSTTGDAGQDQDTTLEDATGAVVVIVNTAEKVTVLPEYYTVVRRVPLTDALWRIAAMSFVYDEALYWERLYIENKNVLRDPNNPHLIFPGQVLRIPSVLGESRAGTYDETLEYVTFEEALQLENIAIPENPNY